MDENHNGNIHVLGDEPSLFSQFLVEVRDHKIQKDRVKFRRNIGRLGEIFAYHISQTLEYSHRRVTTPLGNVEMPSLINEPVIVSILRAGLPLHQGILNYFDNADNGFVSAYRKDRENQNGFEVKVEYIASPCLKDRVVILADPMLATGSSLLLAYDAICKLGPPAHIHLVSLIASKVGLQNITSKIPSSMLTIWLGAIDEVLDEKSYIVPGLGDAGDLAYGTKI
ncbi:uncharacterized protein TRIADDRAFT_19984 [Trichoplax adhaerens]|uniref:uracil phosphoribosyltransferase n=1 Tax=Trichoplax adhaerens TaxID=10228 RepID=B3RI24_TRIAD|nr:hypothetical protein TRIADDRAFT_19984 [Trichoplax adhaerens]EDV28960.1 hypothetical protein TRIADDRAFT_19984 [Trichoplax adhaerens]|eukprot:XP_002108162.1 hypothetical protein TRIADDRAFT_19984 [Trichoplax adhaerens]